MTPTTSNVTTHIFNLDSYLFHVRIPNFSNELSLLCEAYYYASMEDDNFDSTQFDLVPPTKPVSPTDDLVPSTPLVAKHEQAILPKPMKVLFDTGSNISLLNASCLPVGISPDAIAQPRIGITAAGPFESTRTVSLHDLIFPEFSRSKRIPNWTFYIFDTPCPYDVIFGRDICCPDAPCGILPFYLSEPDSV